MQYPGAKTDGGAEEFRQVGPLSGCELDRLAAGPFRPAQPLGDDLRIIDDGRLHDEPNFASIGDLGLGVQDAWGMLGARARP